MSARSHPDQEQPVAPARNAVRSAVRFPLELPVTLLAEGNSFPARTVDISSTGVLFNTDVVLETGTQLQWKMLLPAAAMGTQKDISVECTGRVVWSQDARPVRLAVIIDEYRIEEENR